MSELLEINELNFDAEVLASARPFLLDFSATWCGPCRALTPLLEQLARELGSAVRIGKIDMDEAPTIIARYGVRAAPTLIMFANGQEVRRQVGAGSRHALLKLVAVETPQAAVGA